MSEDVSIIIEGAAVEALEEYQRATHKDMVDIINDFGRDVAGHAIKFTKAASRAEIDALPSMPWWPKYISKRLTKGTLRVRAGTKREMIGNAGAPVFIDPATKRAREYKVHLHRKLSKKMGTTTYRRYIRRTMHKLIGGGTFTRQDAKRASATIINARKRSINFIRAGWLPAFIAFAKATLNPNSKAFAKLDVLNDSGNHPKVYGVAKGSYEIATNPNNPVAILRNAAAGRRSRTPGEGLSRWGRQGLEQSIQFVAQDKHEYAERKLEETAKEFSASITEGIAAVLE